LSSYSEGTKLVKKAGRITHLFTKRGRSKEGRFEGGGQEENIGLDKAEEVTLWWQRARVKMRNEERHLRYIIIFTV
jgi:hypothetical protein